MFQLIYSSVAALPLDSDELDALLGRSRERNATEGISGLLLHVVSPGEFAGAFIQVLEGERVAVERTFHRIRGDDLHRDIRVLAADNIVQRNFADWTMRLEEVPVSQLQSLICSDGTDLLPVARVIVDTHAVLAVIDGFAA